MWPFSRRSKALRRQSPGLQPAGGSQPGPAIGVAEQTRVGVPAAERRAPLLPPAVSRPLRTTGTRADPAELEDEYSGSQPPRFSEVRLRLVPLPDDGRLNVVGESYYQEALRLVAGGKASGTTFDDHLAAVAVLVPEPENPWDEHAVRVDVLVGNRSLKVGYLSSSWAEDYQPELLKLKAEGALGTCPARITGGGEKHYGIYLHVVRPHELRARSNPESLIIAETTGSEVLLQNDWSCTVTKEEEHQDALRAFAPKGKQDFREVVASLGFCSIRSGKHEGQRAIEVRLGGRPVGQLTHAMTQRYGELVEDLLKKDLTVTCEAYTTRTAKGVEVELRMPRDPERVPRSKS
ncbi:HIRAN domain-containing protein [Amycolatopsis sp. CA-128772]|uniref:HIRAN domain-containing protein n=1 Tax=Amycolatopsis sp. CA-128772 TaxID=2073159 RepID=UPI0011B04209|nr:HIRAN domain-containing protein [Amycolatopsis sp. CA-128772]